MKNKLSKIRKNKSTRVHKKTKNDLNKYRRIIKNNHVTTFYLNVKNIAEMIGKLLMDDGWEIRIINEIKECIRIRNLELGSTYFILNQWEI